MHHFASIIAALVLLHSCQAVVHMSFYNQRAWLNGENEAYCTSDPALNWNDIKSFRFWGYNSSAKVEFIAEKPDCDTSTKYDFIVNDDTTGKRLSIKTFNTDIVTLYWINATAQDADYYMCALTPCTATEQKSVTATQLTIVTPPTKPQILHTGDYNVYEGTEVDLIVPCKGYAGYPDGLAYVSLLVPYGDPFHLEQNLTVDAMGYFDGSVSFKYTFKYRYTATIHCVSFNNASYSHKSMEDYRLVNIEYPPTDNAFTTNSTLYRYSVTKVTPGQYVMAAKTPLDVTVTCDTDANPTPNITLSKISAPDNTVQINNRQARIQVSPSQLGGSGQVEVKLQCDSTYKSALSTETVAKTSTLTVTVTAGVSLAKASIPVYLATLLVLLKAFQ